jgi:ligand-binding sensor domain-containing protein
MNIEQYNCRTWRADNGLPGNSINALAADSEGVLWLGTSKGLVRFDGSEFHVAGLDRQGQIVTALRHRSDGGLWYGQFTGGFGYFDEAGAHHLPTAVFSDSFVRDLAEASGGKLLVATTLGAVLSGKNTSPVLLLGDSTDTTAVIEDRRGRLWIGTGEKGLLCFENGTLRSVPCPGLDKAIIKDLAEDREGNLWIATSKGILCLGPDLQALNLPDIGASLTSLMVDQNGLLWVGTNGSGIARYRNGKFEFFRRDRGLAADRVLSLAETPDGCIWIGTADGLTQLSNVKFPTFTDTDGLVTAGSLSVAASPDGGLWVATPDGVSFMKDASFTNLKVESDGLGARWIKQVYPMSNGDAYIVGGVKNIDFYSNGKIRWSRSSRIGRGRSWRLRTVPSSRSPARSCTSRTVRRRRSCSRTGLQSTSCGSTTCCGRATVRCGSPARRASSRSRTA